MSRPLPQTSRGSDLIDLELENSNSPLRRLLAHNDVIFALGVAMILATLLIPLPTFLMSMPWTRAISKPVGTAPSR